jgi:hypothetical protein
VDHVAHGVLVGSDQAGDRRDRCPDDDAMMIVARRTRIGFPRPRRTI